jgi:hypothetical protein
MTDGRVVLPNMDISDAEFRSAMTMGLARAERALGGQRQLAAVMDLSTRQVHKIMNGGSTDPKRLFDVEKVAPGTLRDIGELYGLQLTPIEDADAVAPGRACAPICTLLAKMVEAESDGIVDHRELLDMEPELRAVKAIIDRKLARAAALRRPTVVGAAA